MRTTRRCVILLLLSCGALGGCGESSEEGPSEIDKLNKLTTVTGAVDDHGYSIRVPESYRQVHEGLYHIWAGSGDSIQIRIQTAPQPESLEAAREFARVGTKDLKILFEEDTEQRYLIIGRDTHNTDFDVWIKNPSDRCLYATINLNEVAADDPRIEWAKRVIGSLRAK